MAVIRKPKDRRRLYLLEEQDQHFPPEVGQQAFYPHTKELDLSGEFTICGRIGKLAAAEAIAEAVKIRVNVELRSVRSGAGAERDLAP